MKTFLIAAALGAGLMSPALAADLGASKDGPIVSFPDETPNKDFNGIYAAVFAGYSIGDLHLDTPDEGLASHTPFLGGRIGYDAEIASHIVIGAFAEAAYLSPSILGENLGDHNVDANYELAGGLRAGLVVSRALVYVNGGYAWVPVDFNSSSSSLDLTGPFVGGGVEMALGGGFSIGAEGRYQWLSDDIEGTTINHDDLSARVVLSKHF